MPEPRDAVDTQALGTAGSGGPTPRQQEAAPVAVVHPERPAPSSLSETKGRLQLQIDRVQATCVLALAGELDLATCARLDEAVDASLARPPTLVRIELDGVEFVDSTGLRSLIRAASLFGAAGVELELTRGSERVRRVFELARVTDRLPFVG